MIINVSELSRRKLEALWLHLTGECELIRAANNTLALRIKERGQMTPALLDTLNEWSTVINDINQASSAEVLRIAGKSGTKQALLQSSNLQ